MSTFTCTGQPANPFSEWIIDGISAIFRKKGYEYNAIPKDDTKLAFHFVDRDSPRPYRRKSQATFVVSIVESDHLPREIHKEAYPYLVRSLANHLMYVCYGKDKTQLYFLTPEQGNYSITIDTNDKDDKIFQKIYERLEPLASSQLVIDNHFYEDLPEHLWNGDAITRSLSNAGRKLDQLNLLPAPFPLEDVLSDRDIRHLKKLYGIGGLSYGNLSARQEGTRFWMSASGIDKSNMTTVGQDFLYMTGFDEEKKAMKVSVPPHIKPKRASVDAIEHWMIYKEHPQVGAIIHIHAWMNGITATEINYPCGTVELATTVANLVKNSPDPSRAVIGLKNHGLTITGLSLDDIFERIEGKIIPQVPMQ
ncbi:class II aldolase/adducin family protein [Salipaludibacillus agaradhaerens]|uniref:Class II aldolase/adducin family protein n=1 Tax=Salipaludibacillus agaradhaerens TaxID=76935 RepID=A0A9Q4B132_SALAG|nr:class II aldolase/adducin family protein [Salipaludibacillus agaradhaerens]MCR6096411.1 class II aldolase/adducin family protein [Salipaludibacillus agaradhaerens]MCR6114030.1 class II aldolase/adducin family protein [Salipaludibacillus agaradhaerens]